MTHQIDGPRKGLEWPEAYKDVLPILCTQWGVKEEVYLSRKLSGGKSGALVYLVDISTSSFAGQAILKLDTAFDPSGQEEHEAQLHRRAIEDAPEFAEKHLPRLIHTLHHGKTVALLTTVAGRGLEYSEPWVDCSYDVQLQSVRSVSSGLLEAWNPDYRLTSGMQLPQEFLAGWLAHRLYPEQGGRIHDFLATDCGVPVDAPTIIFEGEWYPNPLAFALGTVDLQDSLVLRGALGHFHGDFHGLNLLVGRRDEADDNYYMIDLAMYESEQFLFFDHAYFELSALLYSRGEASSRDWDAVIAQLGLYERGPDSPGPRADDIGLIELAQAMRTGISNWIEVNEADRLSYMENQALLGRVGAGLSFSNKKMSLQTRQMAFVYGAANLKDYLRLNRIDWVKTGPTFTIADGQQVPPSISSGDHSAPVDEPAISDHTPADASVNENVTATRAPETLADQPIPEQGEISARHRSFPFANLVHELRRRNVIRVAGLYAVVAWLCIQVIVALQSPLQLPEWTIAFVAVLLAIGFPIVCLVTWGFEIGESGLQRTTPEESTDSKLGHRKLVDVAIVIGIVAILVVSTRELLPYFGYETALRPLDESVDLSQFPASLDDARIPLAVLPFADLSGNPDDTFADGLTIEIFNVLAETRAFRMPGMNSTFRYKGNPEDLRTVGQTLNVDYILEGTVRRDGEALRIEANLVRADDGFLVWSSGYRQNVGNVFIAQEEIARSIGSALSTPLDIDADVLEARRTNDPEAYDLFLRGLVYLEQRGTALLEAAGVLERAVELEPTFASAWAALSLVYDLIPDYFREIDGQKVSARFYYQQAREAALTAQNIDINLPMVRHAIGNAFQRQRQWSAAESAYEAALIIDPNDHAILKDYSALLQTVGKRAEAQNFIGRAKELDPLNNLYAVLAAYLRWQSDPTEANIQVIENLFWVAPVFRPIALRTIISDRALDGELYRVRELLVSCGECQDLPTCEGCSDSLTEAATELLNAAESETPENFFEKYKDNQLMSYGLIYSLGGEELALRAFEYYALQSELRRTFYLMPWPIAAELSETSEFQEIIRDLGLMSYWELHGWPDGCQPSHNGKLICA